MQTLNEIRQTFLNYFQSNSHELIPSSPLIPQNDPSLLFTNSGMVQFKDVFTGVEKRPYKRATTAQKCLRAGGKHNDLDNVGYTARHHTFFEMLGNFSFGDYFKDDAIAFAWELITKYFSLPPDRLVVTVFADDDEAVKIWKKVSGFSDSKIIRINTNDNFWSMGDTGPCGPCSEIFYDHGSHIAGGLPGSPDQDGDRFVEIWNLVFMQFEQHADGSRTNLPTPSIDTGMGLERVAAVLQNVHNNFETDLFKTIILASQEFTKNNNSTQIQSHNVIADHLRASSFLIADGVLPSNEGRGYVLRRIMRRAMRHAHILGAKDPLMWKLVPTLVNLMGQSYPELQRAQPLIEQTLKNEEERFKQTLERGLKLLKEETSKLPDNQALPGSIAFRLYDTYGFPLDLTQDVLRNENRSVNTDEFNQAMEQQRCAARQAWSGSGEKANEQIWFQLKDEIGSTEFVGYTLTEAEAYVTAIINNDNNIITQASAGSYVRILTNQTPFYAESGGQVGDSGIISSINELHIIVKDCTKKLNSLHVHECFIEKGAIHVGDKVKLAINTQTRQRVAANHSATHLLHAALREHLGSHVTQKGSLVASDRLRFDFTHSQPLSEIDIKHIESIVNTKILNNTSTSTRHMSPQDAITEGAMALFGERYGDEVRVVSMGGDFSIELCGGTHVHATGDIGLLKIIGESSVAAGIRRIEAITGNAVIDLLYNQENALKAERENSKKQISDLNKQIRDFKKSQSSQPSKNENISTVQIGPYNALINNLQDIHVRDIKTIADQMKKNLSSGIVIVTSTENEKISLVIAVTNDLTSKISAVDLVKSCAQLLGGQGGGGRPDMAQAGGSLVNEIKNIASHLESYLNSQHS